MIHLARLTAIAALTFGIAIAQIAQASGSGLRPGNHAPAARGKEMVRKHSGLLYVADRANNEIDIFPAGLVHPRRMGVITNGVHLPKDVFVDSSGTLYVVNNRPGTVTVYPAGSKQYSRMIALPLAYPFPTHVSFGPDGTLYVVAYDRSEHYYVVEYDQGATSPSRVVDVPFETEPCCATVGGIALDASDNMYLNWGESYECCGYGVLVYAPHALQSSSGFSLGSGLAGGAIEIDANNVIYIGDSADSQIQVAQLPSPTSFTAISTAGPAGYSLSLDAQSNFLYTLSDNGKVQIYNYVTGRFLGSISGFAEATGIAVSPPAF